MSKETFDKAIAFTLHWEGGYVDNPHDPGGATNMGIAQRYHENIDIKNLTVEQAKDIYYKEYWIPAGCDDFNKFTATVLFDTAVNIGLHGAVKCLQRGLNVFDDGVIGEKTLKAANNFADMHTAILMIDQRKRYYQDKVIESPSKTIFLKGWINRCDALEKFIREI